MYICIYMVIISWHAYTAQKERSKRDTNVPTLHFGTRHHSFETIFKDIVNETQQVKQPIAAQTRNVWVMNAGNVAQESAAKKNSRPRIKWQ